MPEPQDVHGVRRFCGMVQYLSKFVPELAETASPLRTLTHKDAEWIWSAEHQTAFDNIKQKVSSLTLLAHYDPNLQN